MTQSSRDPFEPGQVLVYWARSFEAEAALATLASDRKVVPVTTTTLANLGGVLAVFQLRSHAAAAEFRGRLTREFPDAVVDFNTRYRPLQQTPPNVSLPRIYLPKKIDMPRMIERGAAQQAVRVGIVDGPIATIAALSSVPIVRKNFLLATDLPAPASHATAIAALVAGRDANTGFLGVAPNAVLYSAEIMRSRGRDDSTTSAALVLALEWLVSERVKVINLSLGGPGDLVMAQAFGRLANLAVVVVAAAGNGGPAAAPAYPAAYPGTIAVTATDALDDLYVDANHGSYITLSAPGVDLWVPDAGMGHYVSGTSFSAAVVTAATAALLTQNPQLGPRAVAERMCHSAKDLGPKGVDSLFGCGLVQLGAMLREGI
jgi:subtilisin family serine protease